MKKLLCIGWVWPEPNSSAAGYNILSLLKTFNQQDWQITFASSAQTTPLMADLQKLGYCCQSIELNSSSFDDFVQELDPQIVIFDRFMIEEQYGWRVLQQCPQALRILNTEDLQFLRQARHTWVKQHGQVANNLEDLDLNTDLAKREIASIYRCDLSLIISLFEFNLLKEHFKIAPSLLHLMPFQLTANTSQAFEYDQRQHFITVGNFRHAPNWDAVLWLKQAIWPAIRQQLPKAELHIYGSYTPPKATQLNCIKTGFLIKGWANDVHQVMKKAKVCLAPLKFGAGLKGKIADAMLNQTPVVTTSIGAEGMFDSNNAPGFIENDTNAFVARAIELFADKSTWLTKSEKCLSLIQQHYQPETISKSLIEKVELVRHQLNAHRQENFIGQMLNHHTMQSTKYMAQWIEAKNRINT
ncbi:glycosyltransferase [Saccharobesus litoralis]|uniref:Glycosyltransferase n=1 Tax=Saccharobesus litoralis TaxID=2172099 RepID=A0A2S0VTR5_9ALTE|nr:glycosyltransferase family 4 protein [Saccharobesus litoralis]AWB67599.1 glycosyltransferase [Saccharobesus litoralis]